MALTVNHAGGDWGCSVAHHQATAAVVREVVKAAPAKVISISVSNSTAVVYYLQLFDLAVAPAASDATGFVEAIPIPASTTVGGREISIPDKGIGFLTGLAIKICGAAAGNDNTAAAAGVIVSIRYI